MKDRALLRQIPQVDVLLREQAFAELEKEYGRPAVRDALRVLLVALRERICTGEEHIPDVGTLAAQARERLADGARLHLRRVLNATGVALHTNLGRAALCEAAKDALLTAAGYTNLEFDLERGGRGSRSGHLEPLLCALCGCEAAMVVNNNAAALLLALHTLAPGREVLLSRGELVEIGDGFRVPDILLQSGCVLREVGATNRTHPADYADAIDSETALLLKVHTSNYRVVGFSSSVSVGELAMLAHTRDLPLLVDLGSGALLEAEHYPFADEPTVPQTLRDGADLVCFSADKLLGGPQAGILAGKAEYIERMRRDPLARALRIDKLSLAALEATLRMYDEPARALREIPTLAALAATPDKLLEKAQRLCACAKEAGVNADLEVRTTKCPIGGGAAPGELLPGCAVAVLPHSGDAQTLKARLCAGEPAMLARIVDGALLLEVAALSEDELQLAAKLLADALR